MEEQKNVVGNAQPTENQTAETTEKLPPLKRFWKSWGDCLIIFAVALLLFTVVLRFEKVPTESMEPTVPAGTIQISWRLPYLIGDPMPKRGDVVSFYSEEYGEVLLKRVVGLPGEEISFSGGNVYIDGKRLEESYLPEQGITEDDGSYTVPEGCVFLLGDNRGNSLDARDWTEPYIIAEDLQAKALIVISIGGGHTWTGIRWVG